MITYQSGLITATVNQKRPHQGTFFVKVRQCEKVRAHTHIFFRPLSTPLHVTAHSTDLALGVGRPQGMGDREVPPVSGGRPRDSP